VRPEIAKYGDVVASVVNLQFHGGAIGNVESYVQAIYGYDVRSEIVGSKGTILVGSLWETPATFLTVSQGSRTLSNHFLKRFADAYIAELRNFVESVLNERPPEISGADGLRALAIAVAAENSFLRSQPVRVLNE
jgi:predicted dehydrogenase